MFRTVLFALAAFTLTRVGHAGELGIHVILSGQLAPGVYGQVQLGAEQPPPPLVYAQPVLIEPQAAPPQPVYLHVPPGHARNWRKHCHAYNACNRPVYFVRSDEYSPHYRDHRQDYGHGHGNGSRGGDDDHGRDRGDHDREHRDEHRDEH
jgi:hypothetical protein